MRMLLFAVAIWSGILAAPALAAPVDPALQAELLKIFDAFNAAAKKGDFKAAAATRDADTRRNMESQLRSDKQRKEFLAEIRMMTPAKVVVQDSWGSSDGGEAELDVLATMVAPPRARGKNGVPADGIVQQPMSLTFKREGTAWKYATSAFKMSPSQGVKCDENVPEAEAAFDDRSNLSIGGPIKRVKFADAYTAIVIDVVGEENCLYLPNKAFLQRAGLNTDLLEPRAMLEAEGYKHKSDKQKAWVTGMNVTKR